MSKKYNYSNLTVKNSSFFKRFSHKKRFEKALKLADLSDENSILDFGTGDGYFLNLLRENTHATIVGYEPIDDMFEQLEKTISDKTIKIINNLNAVKEKFDVVYCLEVLEHFREEHQIKRIKEIKSKLNKNGR